MNFANQTHSPTPWAPQVRRSSVVLARLAEDVPAEDGAAVETPSAVDDVAEDPTIDNSDYTPQQQLAEDVAAATKRARAFIARHPSDSLDAVARKLIRSKSISTSLYGLILNGASAIPGFRTLAFGVGIDAALITKLQMELVLELCALYGKANEFVGDVRFRQNALYVATGLRLAADLTSPRSDADTSNDEEATFVCGTEVATAARAALSAKGMLGKAVATSISRRACTHLVCTNVMGVRSVVIFRDGIDHAHDWVDDVSAVDISLLSGWVVDSLSGPRMRALQSGLDGASSLVRRSLSSLRDLLSSQSAAN